jgi:c-di-GMP-binding flagellar brake protein YcgR
MFLDTQPARVDGPPGAGADDEFSVTKPAEILNYLQRLIDTRALINLSSPDGGFLTTMLWWVDAAAQDIGFSVDEHQIGLQEVAGAGESVAVTYLENEKLQFPLARMRLKRDPQGLALQCQLPELIIRFQRRKSFRVRLPGFDAPTLRFRMPGNPDHVIVGRIVDISIGGCGLVVPTDTPPFEPGTALPSCRVDLTAEERFITGFEIRRSAPWQNKQGHTLGTLLGCRWTRLDSAAERTLQVYINRRQKHQRSAAPQRR